jgi:DNA (cytosine-5)-methyltransferase 1
MPQYPLLDVIQDNALAVLADRDFIAEFDVIAASPVCKRYTALATRSPLKGQDHPDDIATVRDLLWASGKPYVIENVVGAPLIEPVTLCGSMFGLGVGNAILKRHRLFESNIPLTEPRDACKGRPVVGVYGTGGAWTRTAPGGGGVKVSGPDAARALGVDWTNYQPVLAQMIPPAYTEHIGRQLMTYLQRKAA